MTTQSIITEIKDTIRNTRIDVDLDFYALGYWVFEKIAAMPEAASVLQEICEETTFSIEGKEHIQARIKEDAFEQLESNMRV